jgi:hypothetical protein
LPVQASILKFAFKNPDWTYSIPAAVEEPAPSWRRFDFRHEIDELESTEFWKLEDRIAKTLLKEGNFRIVLTLMKAGAVLKEHKAEGNVSIHVLRGRIRVRLDHDTVEGERFELKVPPGKYEIAAWQEKFGEQTQTVEIADHEKKDLVFTFKEAGTD